MTSLVLPAYNPGNTVVHTWTVVRDFIRSRPDPWEAIFVCDGCTDGTDARLNALAADTGDARMHVLGYRPNRGKGYAVRIGLLAARGDYRLFTDIDLAYDFADITRVAAELAAGAAVAIASRTHPESQVQLPVKMLGYAYRRSVQSRVFGSAARLLLPLAQRDTQAGLKGMSGPVAEWLLPALTCDGFGFDCELLTACRRAGVPVREVPVCVRYDDAASTTGAGTMVKMLGDLWRIRRGSAGRGLPPRPGPSSRPVRRAA